MPIYISCIDHNIQIQLRKKKQAMWTIRSWPNLNRSRNKFMQVRVKEATDPRWQTTPCFSRGKLVILSWFLTQMYTPYKSLAWLMLMRNGALTQILKVRTAMYARNILIFKYSIDDQQLDSIFKSLKTKKLRNLWSKLTIWTKTIHIGSVLQFSWAQPINGSLQDSSTS